MLESLALFCAFLALALGAMPPSITFGDAGEFACAAATLSLPHSPGYPLYCLLGKALGTAFPWGNWAYRTNLLSAACSATALAVLNAALACAGFRRGARWAALACLAFSSVWRYETVVTEVFALNGLILAWVLWLACRYRGVLACARPMAALGLAFGFGMSNHHTIVLAFPAVALEAWASARGALASRTLLRALLVFSGFFALGMLLYLYLPLRSSRGPFLDWGHPTSLDRFLRVFLRKDYGSFSLTVEGAQNLRPRLAQVARYCAFTARELGAAPFVLSLIGLAFWSRSGAALGRLLPASVLVLTGPFFLVLGNPPFDAQTSGALERFYLFSWMAACFPIAAAVQWLERAVPYAGWAVLAWALAAGTWSRGGWFARGEVAAYDYGRNVARSLPARSSLYMDGGDDTFYSLAFLLGAQGNRKDLDLHDRGAVVYRNPYGPDFRSLPESLKEARRAAVESALAEKGTLYYSTLNENLLPGYALSPAGLLRKAEKSPRDASRPGLWEIYPYRLEDGLLNRHYRYRALASIYPFLRGKERAEGGDYAQALAHWKWAWGLAPDALWMRPTLSYAAGVAGFQAFGRARWEAAEGFYRLACAVSPESAQPRINLGAALEKSGRPRQAEEIYLQGIKIDPGSAQAYYNLGVLYWSQRRWAESAEALDRAAGLKPGEASWKKFAMEARARGALK